MRKVRVNIKDKSGGNSYDIIIGSGVLKSFSQFYDTSKCSSVALVVDKALLNQEWYKTLLSSNDFKQSQKVKFIEISGAESVKNVDGLSYLWHEFQKSGLDRKSLVVILGGGAILDLAGFAASTYMRGVAFIHVPTTLLSQVDASIGGKLAINLGEFKNLVGSFAQPKAVIIDLETLVALPYREFVAGIAEIVKHGLIYDRKYLSLLEKTPLKQNDQERLMDIITRSCEIKSEVVSLDETEDGLRKTLNFGHTAGHALESLSKKTNYPLLHGEAISLGMLVETEISKLIGFISQDDVNLVRSVLQIQGLPVKLEFSIDLKEAHRIMLSDKKNVASKIKWSLLEKLGKATFDVEVETSVVEKAFEVI
jgi:3-dehydroquinate synthase